MSQHEEKINILKKYYKDMQMYGQFYIQGDIKDKLIDNAMKKSAYGLNKESIIGFYDTSILGSGKSGYIFTDDKVYYILPLDKPHKLWYDDIESLEIVPSGKKSDLKFKLYDGTIVTWQYFEFNIDPLYEFFKEIKALENGNSDQSANLRFQDNRNFGAIASGLEFASVHNVKKSFEEEKFHARQGHGFAAERANNLYDQLTGHKAKIVGDNNVKNGPDRIVDGVWIQSKYCQTGQACINECFDNDGNFRYMHNGKPMQIEVPSNKWETAVEAMQQKIKNGQVPGVTDPNEAKNIVRKGHFTYEQVKNIAKAGNVDSLIYDATNGVIISSSAFGVTAAITLAVNLWNGEDFDKSLKIATFSGLKVGGTAFITTIVASQLSKAGLNSALVGSTEAVAAFMGPKASAVLINAFRSGSNSIYGAAAMKSAAKLLRGNVITAGVTMVILSSFDITNIFKGRISGKQLFKNITNTASTVAGGTGGWVGGATVGSAILPGLGTVVGGLVGSVAAGSISGKATDKVLSSFIKDDADEMIKIIQDVFEELAGEYLLNHKEAEKSVDRLGDKLTGNILKEMFSQTDREQYARDMLVPIIENELKKRKHVVSVTDDQMIIGLREVLEDIADIGTDDVAFV